MFPHPTPIATKRCLKCGTLARVDRMTGGYGSRCAEELGLTITTPRLRTDAQTGTDLLDLLNEGDHLDEPDDECDGWDR